MWLLHLSRAEHSDVPPDKLLRYRSGTVFYWNQIKLVQMHLIPNSTTSSLLHQTLELQLTTQCSTECTVSKYSGDIGWPWFSVQFDRVREFWPSVVFICTLPRRYLSVVEQVALKNFHVEYFWGETRLTFAIACHIYSKSYASKA